MKAIASLTICMAIVIAGCATRQPLQFAGLDEAFNEDAAARGLVASKVDCERASNAVWVADTAVPTCIRYWAAGLDRLARPPRRALAYFAGDVLAGDRLVNDSYAQMTTAKLRTQVEAAARQRGVPYVFIGRPGTYGSSGDHKQRRRFDESRIITATLDQLKHRLGVDEWVLVGQSGGGHVVASLLTLRSDIVCAVPTSSPSSPRMRWTALGLQRDTTGFSDSYEPVEHLGRSTFHPELRVFVLGDPADANVPIAAQRVLSDRLRVLGIEAHFVPGTGLGLARHQLSSSAIRLGAMCLQGLPTIEILKRSPADWRG